MDLSKEVLMTAVECVEEILELTGNKMGLTQHKRHKQAVEALKEKLNETP